MGVTNDPGAQNVRGPADRHPRLPRSARHQLAHPARRLPAAQHRRHLRCLARRPIPVRQRPVQGLLAAARSPGLARPLRLRDPAGPLPIRRPALRIRQCPGHLPAPHGHHHGGLAVDLSRRLPRRLCMVGRLLRLGVGPWRRGACPLRRPQHPTPGQQVPLVLPRAAPARPHRQWPRHQA